MRSSRRRLGIVIGLIITSLVAGACGDDDDDATGPGSTPASEPSGSPDDESTSSQPGGGPDTTEPAAGDDLDRTAILRVGTPLSANQGPIFDISDHNQGSSVQWLDLIYDTMIRKTTTGLEPGLATEWEILDPSTLEIQLREGVEFQDGTPFDAAAVAGAWNRPKADHLRAEVKAVANVEVLEPLRVQVTFSQPVAGDFVNLTMIDSYFPVPSPAALAEWGDDYESHPVGAGPYAFESYTPDQEIRLRAWDGYWDAESQVLAGVDFVQVAPGAPTVTALGSGQIDLAQIAAAEVGAVEGLGGFEVTSRPTPSITALNLCLNQPPFDSLQARQAIAHLVDREELNIGVYQSLGTPTDQWHSTDDPQYSDAVADRYPHDVERARELWEESGAPTSFTILGISAAQELVRTTEILQSQFAEIGLDVDVTTAPNAQDLVTVNPAAAPFPVRPATWGTYYGENGFLNWCGYDNEEFFETMRYLGGGTGSEADVTAGWDRAAEILATDLPAIWLVAGPVLVAHGDDVVGVDFIRPTFGMAADLRGVGVRAG